MLNRIGLPGTPSIDTSFPRPGSSLQHIQCSWMEVLADEVWIPGAPRQMLRCSFVGSGMYGLGTGSVHNGPSQWDGS